MKTRMISLIAAFIILILSLSHSVHAQTGELEVHFLNVDQGDSILLKGPDFTILIDAGRHDRNDVLPQLQAIGVTSIDLFVGTHPHADHIGQAWRVFQAYPVAEAWMSGDVETTVTFERTLDAIEAEGAGYTEPRAGEVYNIGSARLEVLNPAHLGFEDINDGSIVIRLVFGSVAFLFTGDAEAVAETEMLDSGRNLQAQILKLGHHGSSSSSTLEFLQAVDPEIAIWSAGQDNDYGHPHPSTINRLAQLGIETHGTATEGTIIVCTDGQTYHLGACETPAFNFQLRIPGVSNEPVPTSTSTSTPTPTATTQSEATATNTPTATSTSTSTATSTPTATPTPTATTPSQGPCPCNANTLNCSDFDTQPEAQACFNWCVSQGAGDIHGLDGSDNDGLACESLPGGFKVLR